MDLIRIRDFTILVTTLKIEQIGRESAYVTNEVA